MIHTKKWAVMLLAVLLMLSPTSILAAEGNGGGGGNGGGNNSKTDEGEGDGKKQLVLESVTPEDGAADVDPNSEIILTFSNNVVNMKVADRNKELIKLVDKEGNEVPATINMADDQIEPEKKREVVVKPDSSLVEGEQYKLVVEKGMQAKNGTSTEEAYEVAFTTTAEAATENTGQDEESVQTEGTDEQVSNAEASSEDEANSNSLLYGGAVTLVAIIIMAVILTRKKNVS